MTIDKFVDCLRKSLENKIGNNIKTNANKQRSIGDISEIIYSDINIDFGENFTKGISGKKSIHDDLFIFDNISIGVDYSNVSLQEGVYSDGGKFTPDNFLRFIDNGFSLVIVETLYDIIDTETIRINNICIADATTLDVNRMRNAGTQIGQIRFNDYMKDMIIDQTKQEFEKKFLEMIKDSYNKLIKVTEERISRIDKRIYECKNDLERSKFSLQVRIK